MSERKIVVDLPSNLQVEYNVKPSAVNAPGNGYTGPGTVLWNELVDGDISGSYDVPGGWISDEMGGIEFSQSRYAAHLRATSNLTALNINADRIAKIKLLQRKRRKYLRDGDADAALATLLKISNLTYNNN